MVDLSKVKVVYEHWQYEHFDRGQGSHTGTIEARQREVRQITILDWNPVDLPQNKTHPLRNARPTCLFVRISTMMGPQGP